MEIYWISIDYKGITYENNVRIVYRPIWSYSSARILWYNIAFQNLTLSDPDEDTSRNAVWTHDFFLYFLAFCLTI